MCSDFPCGLTGILRGPRIAAKKYTSDNTRHNQENMVHHQSFIYLAAILFVTQKLANRCNLKKYTTLTATHDNLLSWSGIGSALNNLYIEFSLPASILETLSIVGYLGLIMVIHITTPALFSVPIFNISTSSVVPTLGIPQWNQSNHEPVIVFMDKTINFLPWIHNLDDTLGLFNGSLYDVLQDTNLGNGSAEISLTGFNISCGYLPGINTDVQKASGWEPSLWDISFDSNIPSTSLLSYGPNIIGMYLAWTDPVNNSIILYTTNDVVDSHGQKGSPITLKEPMGPNSTVSQLQFLQCSNWWKYDNSTMPPPPDETLIGSSFWSDFLGNVEDDWSYIPENDNTTVIIDYMSNTREYLMEELRLNPSWIASGTASTSVPVLKLHEIENALSSLVASIFWIAGHITPGSIISKYSSDQFEPGLSAIGFNRYDTAISPVLSVNNTVIQQTNTACRLDLNVLFLAIGLSASILLSLLAIQYWTVPTHADDVADAGLLHVIWMFQHQPELELLLPQVSHPTDKNLRMAGLVKARVSSLNTKMQIPEDIPFTRLFGSRHIANEIRNECKADSCSPLLPKKTEEESYLQPTFKRHQRAICIACHISLILVHIALLGVWFSPHAEHAITFPINLQGRMASLLTALATGVGTRIMIQRSLQVEKTLTATHDNTMAWSGLGSALGTVYQQLSIPASVKRSLLILGYLTTIWFLHLTTPLLFSVESYSSAIMLTVPTQGLPELNNSASMNDTTPVFFKDLDFLPWMENLQESETLGLFNGSLYDTLENLALEGVPTQVPTAGFNISCGYLLGENIGYVQTDLFNEFGFPGPYWEVSLPSFDETILMSPTGPNVIAFLPGLSNETVILYTTNQVIDSVGRTGSPVQLKYPMGPNLTISHLQFMQCTKSVVNQTGMIDPKTGRLIGTSLNPSIWKDHSTWQAYANDTTPTLPQDNRFVASDLWAQAVAQSSQTGIGLSYTNTTMWNFLTYADIHVMDQLGLDPSWIGSGVDISSGCVLKLHDIENALANLVASMFWIAGHIHQPSLIQKYEIFEKDSQGGSAPVLSSGNVEMQVVQSAARLNLNILAVSLGLGASIILCALAVIVSQGTTQPTTLFNGMGLLHIIWLLRNHPELNKQLERVEEPRNYALRAAGMIRIQMLGDSLVAVES
ncbi:hypothetical protein K438DRAFT_2164498 [Mycena galopus ATCC 62051]|nr:hypothetical protein K438DRAFT_2164498 [Mycena galopus ATCC 62051]